MPTTKQIEHLTPLDLSVIGGYIPVICTFETSKKLPTTISLLQTGLNKLVAELPWLAGHVVETTSGGRKRLHIEYDTTTPAPTVFDKGTIEPFYEALAAKGMPSESIPLAIFPIIPTTSNIPVDKGASPGEPVFAASLFRFNDGKGVGLCVMLHHRVVDARGMCEVMRLWTAHITSATSGSGHTTDALLEQKSRLPRLQQALATELAAVKATGATTDDLLTLHPEFSRTPGLHPASVPDCTSKMFTIMLSRMEAIKRQIELPLRAVGVAVTTNMIVTAILWPAVTRARMQRDPSLVGQRTRLVTPINVRARIGSFFSTRADPYFGNTVVRAMTGVLASRLELQVPSTSASTSTSTSTSAFTSPSPDPLSLIDLCRTIGEIQSPAHMNARFIAECCALADGAEDFLSIYSGTFDFLVNSWADLELYELDFGPGLGRPTFCRLPYIEVDGVAFIAPRRRGSSDEMLEVAVMLRRDVMAALEDDPMWKGLVSSGHDR
ncbi:hypothetical protein BDW74DRAFT_186042 [Aspergillus multicolor]|uniref:uncharacterized protein n=1 Tax=Aspergillus multicolor TaxID=41759 RepID=UPI003CCE1A24